MRVPKRDLLLYNWLNGRRSVSVKSGNLGKDISFVDTPFCTDNIFAFLQKFQKEENQKNSKENRENWTNQIKIQIKKKRKII